MSNVLYEYADRKANQMMIAVRNMEGILKEFSLVIGIIKNI